MSGEKKAQAEERGSVGLPERRERATANETRGTGHPAQPPAKRPRTAPRSTRRKRKTDRRQRPLIVLGYPSPGTFPLSLQSTYGSPAFLDHLSRCVAKTARVLRRAGRAGPARPKRKRGRPRGKRVAVAVEMRLAGKPWGEIWPRVIRNYWRLDSIDKEAARAPIRNKANKILRRLRVQTK